MPDAFTPNESDSQPSDDAPAAQGLSIPKVFSSGTSTVYAARVCTDPATGESFSFEAPVAWSDQAVTILATKYARKTGVQDGAMPYTRALDSDHVAHDCELGAETSARQIFGRLAGAWAHWGHKLGYFDTANAQAFRAELTAMLEQQVAAPNSPQWFNTGLAWAYGITGKAQGHYAAETTHCKGVYRCPDAYTRPQVHACFIQSVEDDLVGEGGIMDLILREARLFKFGSGTGTNYSSIRAKGEPLSGGGTSSGVLSFLKVSDRSADAIKSGGTTRRSARMVILDVDHPDVEEFIGWKPREEEKIRALRGAGIGDPKSFEDEATATVSGQNGNNSVRVTDDFMDAAVHGDDFDLTWRTNGEVARTVDASALWHNACRAAWECGAPGVQFHDTINKWNTCASDGEIDACNPCAEYCFLHDTACNLASLNLVKFVDDAGDFAVEKYKHAARLWTIVLDISVSMAGYPSESIAARSMEYRTLGLGYANLGGLLMRKGIPYDSEEGRAYCSRVTSLLGAYSWQTSAELSKLLGPFPAYERNQEHVLRILSAHAENAFSLASGDAGALATAWDSAKVCAEKQGARNAQCTLLAPTGTIGLVMDCDSTGIEPVYALQSTKVLAGGGKMSIVCSAAKAYALGERVPDDGEAYTLDISDPVLACANDIPWLGHLGMMAAAQPFLDGAISKTVNLTKDATVEDISDAYTWAWEHGIKAVALYRDGSKATQVLTHDSADEKQSSAESIEEYVQAVHDNAHGEAQRLSSVHITDTVTAVSATFNGAPMWDSKPLAGILEPDAPLAGVLARGQREEPPAVRRSDTAKLKIAGASHYITVGRFDDGRPCEVFITPGKAGGAVRGWAEAFSIMLSRYLQLGGDLDSIIAKLRFQRFEPAGFVTDAPLGIRQATSPVDALAQLLSALQSPEGVTPSPEAVAVAVSEHLSAPKRLVVNTLEPAPEKPTRQASANAVCSHCGSLDLQPAGTCLRCNTCGTTTGCG